MMGGMARVWGLALVWLVAAGVASTMHWRTWDEQHPVMVPEDCALQFPPSSVELVGCYEERMDLAQDRRAQLTLHVAAPLVPAGILVLLALSLGWLQRE